MRSAIETGADNSDGTARSGTGTNGVITRSDLRAIAALASRLRGSWSLTHTAMVISVSGWSLLWVQALYGPPVIPQMLAAAGFFFGLGLAGFDQRRIRRADSGQLFSLKVLLMLNSRPIAISGLLLATLVLVAAAPVPRPAARQNSATNPLPNTNVIAPAPNTAPNPAAARQAPAPRNNAASTSAPAEPANLNANAAEDGQWLMPAKNYASTRYSGLNQITAANANQLKVAWTFTMGSDHGQEAAPIVVNGTMYIVGPYPNTVFALDATTGELKWKYQPNTDPSSQGVACCDVVNRGMVYDNGKVFFNTLDNHTVALDARTGNEVWVTRLGDISRGQTLTMAPLAVKGKILVGNSGGEMGVRGWLTALDEATGKIAWRGYSTGPDSDVLIGSDFRAFYAKERGQNLGVTSWPAGKWQIGGGPVWGWISYDPALNLIYYGSGNPGPWNSNQRPGDNLWTSTIFARDVDTGAVKWAHQLNPHDLWDHDEINEQILLNLPIRGQMRPVLIHIGRDGYMWVMDRRTGEVLSADPYETITAYTGIDMRTGQPIPNTALTPIAGKNITNVCPASPGGKDWQPSAYSPRTGLIYVPHQHICMDYKTAQVGYIAGTPYVGAVVDMYAGPGGYRGEYMAWDPVNRRKAWTITEKFPVWSGTLVTAGDVAFYGTLDRWFKAIDARNGKVLWQFRAGSGFVGQPVTYRGIDGNQYVAILSGVGGWPGAVANSEIDPRVRNGALGFNGATQDLPGVTAGGGELLVFSLAGPPTAPPPVIPPAPRASAPAPTRAASAAPARTR